MRFHESFSNLLKSEARCQAVQFLLHHEASMSEREMASILNISHMSVNRILKELAQKNLVHYKTVGKAHLWQVNRKSLAYKILTRFFDNLKTISDPMSELKRLIFKYLPEALVERVILFGSIAKGEEKPNSDIDLFILVKNAQDQKELEKFIEKLSSECLDIFGNRLAPYILTKKQYNEKKGLNIISKIHEGIQLYPNGEAKP